MTREASTPGIAVIGGGLTGLMTAAALSHAGPRIHLIDRTESNVTHPDERTTTINAAGARMLAALGAWERFETPPAAVTRIAVAEGPPPGQRPVLAVRRRADGICGRQCRAAVGPS